ncbi:MAG: glycosyl hydrolase [Bacteroidetes Order II. Incertae sedis bacterium]|nr:glycosyl hydrolase [Bacteroidetes Order II. bacterium]MBT4052277.1 glycosyl hydrolase [Bacteroidetes Order II. bacterium]MBT4601938.1 glycosyl hydrolase [Bacteroidetes Order II. bacterium]MBT5248711.1 glycosyl hydrolase [Bacteroidetes Order II. bacterium]MBT6201623.1 glycosyl hydrolase [Bacteroidetes Order II. bacterium]
MTRIFTVLAVLALFVFDSQAQSIDPSLYEGLDYRLVGPYRGGRSAAVTGVPGKPLLYYMGTTGGGVWRTKDGGQSWSNLSDGYFGGSIGAVAVSEWDNNVIYVGGGEKTIRGNVSHGYGMWKSTDAGKTWKSIGLGDSRHISRIRIHPRNPDLVYASVMGHLAGPNEERGVYRSKDGGDTWENILYVSDEAGAMDLVMDPSNPRVLYASMWEFYRSPYEMSSGGENSGLHRSTDGGDTWEELTNQDNGLPGGTIGIIGVAISPVNADRVWAIIEHEDGGVYRSDNGGESWRRINTDRNLRQRAWYYTRIYAGTQDEDDVWVLNVGLWHSNDGGSEYERVRTPHGDHHDFWIAPEDADRLIVADDGGGQVSFDGGENWSTYMNQPTAQFYRVHTDNNFPYRIYGGQQDNSTVRILHTSTGRSERDWESTAGGESAWLASHPNDPDIVYGGSYGGSFSVVNHRTGQSRSINVWPDNPMGHGAEDFKYRFQWNFPIIISRHNSDAVLATSQHVHRSTDMGQSWDLISPDLTRNDPTTLGPSGGPITKDNTAVEYYATIFTLAEGEEEGVIWTGSDDGLVHVTRDGGATWTNVTPPEKIFPEWMMVNDMVVDPFNPGGLYMAGTKYKSDDFTPYLYKTDDYGASWTKITDGIPADHFTRTIEADPERQGLLYAGTETGMYISFDDGASWQSFQQNLPIVPITDLEWRDNDLVVATQGRAFWIMEDVMHLHHVSAEDTEKPYTFHSPYVATLGAENSVRLRYWFAEDQEKGDVTMRILEEDGSIIRTYDDVDAEAGVNQFNWNMGYEDAESFDGLVMWAGSVRGPQAVPGRYQARLIVGEDSTTVGFEIAPDPRSDTPLADLEEKFDFLIAVRDKLSETHKAIKQIRSLRNQVNDVLDRIPEDHVEADTINGFAQHMLDGMKEVEEALYQTKNRSGQDPLNFPIRLNNKLAAVGGVSSRGHFRPTDQAYAVRDELVAQIDEWLTKLADITSFQMSDFEEMVQNVRLPVIKLDS